ncbi:DUF1345 domain-containing protein [Microlunatus speluncae]|uniref:DUF1345 domain-containing protein n=1 Tax=Microlunatus speluncae TaxID=2594267 RepID=UPI0012666341|nr:DUF1345 domain-containing protein [Microlunatus speluncae]
MPPPDADASPDSPPAPRMVDDVRRTWISTTAMAVLVMVGAVAFAAIGTLTEAIPAEVLLRRDYFVLIYFCAWTIYCVIYLGLTLRTLRPPDGRTLAGWLREDNAGRQRRRLHELMSGSGGPAAAVGFCVVAVGAVIISATLPELRGVPAVIALAFLVVAASWTLIIVVYAVHYARENSNFGGLDFPNAEEEGPPEFVDYLYLAIQVTTTFSTSDVTIGKRRMRRVVSTHSVVAFVFNTVIIALLVSLLLSATS